MTGAAHIAFFVPSLNVGGAQRVTVTVANGLSERGYEVDLIVAYHEGGFREEVSTDVSVVDLETPHVPVIGLAASVPQLGAYLRRQSPEMIFSQMTHANGICLLTHLITGSDAITVPTIHNTLGIRKAPKQRIMERVTKQLSGRADQFVAVSEGVAESAVDCLGVERDRVSVLYNPIPVSEIRERARAPVDHRWIESAHHDVVLSVGRLEPQKDLQTLLRAFKVISKRRPDARAIFVGQGSQREELEGLAERLGIADVVSFPGYVENPYGYMAGASVLAMSSIYEGLPTVLIEALACGCPVVSTDCPSGPREILSDGEYGRLVGVGEDEELAEAILATLGEPPSSETLVGRARDFAPETVLDEYESFVRDHAPSTGGTGHTPTSTPGPVHR